MHLPHRGSAYPEIPDQDISTLVELNEVRAQIVTFPKMALIGWNPVIVHLIQPLSCRILIQDAGRRVFLTLPAQPVRLISLTVQSSLASQGDVGLAIRVN